MIFMQPMWAKTMVRDLKVRVSSFSLGLPTQNVVKSEALFLYNKSPFSTKTLTVIFALQLHLYLQQLNIATATKN